jgi:hypothetical protein
MIATMLESIPTVWVEERDTTFFRCVITTFSPAFLAGASVLLASYDPDDDYGQTAPNQPQPAVLATAVCAPTASPQQLVD